MTSQTIERGLTRRALLSRTAAASPRWSVGANFICAADAAWALEVTDLKPETAATLVLMARDIYPHDRLADQFYAVAVKGYDTGGGGRGGRGRHRGARRGGAGRGICRPTRRCRLGGGPGRDPAGDGAVAPSSKRSAAGW